jgi:uncharacterized protein (DUF433 family)
MATTLNHHIESTPNVCSGKPRIARTRITIADIVITFLRMGQSLEIVAGKYDLAPAAVYAAMSRLVYAIASFTFTNQTTRAKK